MANWENLLDIFWRADQRELEWRAHGSAHELKRSALRNTASHDVL